MKRDLEQRVAQSREEVERIGREMSDLAHRFEGLAPVYAVAWVEEMVRERLTKDHAKTKSQPERLGELKARLAEFQETIPRALQDQFSTDYWSHTGDVYAPSALGDSNRFEPRAGRYRGSVERPFRVVLGRLGPILDEFGYVSLDAWREWRHDEGAGEWRRDEGTGEPRWFGELKWPQEMRETVYEYGKLHSELVAAVAAVRAAEGARNEAEAQDLWDKA